MQLCQLCKFVGTLTLLDMSYDRSCLLWLPRACLWSRCCFPLGLSSLAKGLAERNNQHECHGKQNAIADIRGGRVRYQICGVHRCQELDQSSADAGGNLIHLRTPFERAKRARLRVVARYVKTGAVKFPRSGRVRLLGQLLGFGREKHDEAVYAPVYLIIELMGEGIAPREIH